MTLDKLAVKLGPIVLGQATQSSECQALLQQLDLHGDPSIHSEAEMRN